MIADVSQQAEHKREKHQQEQTRTALTWRGEISSGVMVTVDVPPTTETEPLKFPSLACG